MMAAPRGARRGWPLAILPTSPFFLLLLFLLVATSGRDAAAFSVVHPRSVSPLTTAGRAPETRGAVLGSASVDGGGGTTAGGGGYRRTATTSSLSSSPTSSPHHHPFGIGGAFRLYPSGLPPLSASSSAAFHGAASPSELTSAALLPFPSPTAKSSANSSHGPSSHQPLGTAASTHAVEAAASAHTRTNGGEVATTSADEGGVCSESSARVEGRGGVVVDARRQRAPTNGGSNGRTGWPLGLGWAGSLLSSLFGGNGGAKATTRGSSSSLFASSRWEKTPMVQPWGRGVPSTFAGGVAFAAAQAVSDVGEDKSPVEEDMTFLVPQNADFYRRQGLIPLLQASPFPLPELPWHYEALSPAISGEAIEYHYGKHHAAYAKNLNEIAAKDPTVAAKSLEEIVATSPPGPLFNNAAQLYNHTFFWRSMKPNGGGAPQGEVKERIEQSFGSWEEFREQFKKTAVGHFGSGWVWLVVLPDGTLRITEGHDAQTPIGGSAGGNGATEKATPLLTIDIWEHAYYVDYRNARAAYVERWFELVNWDFANHNLEKWRMEKEIAAGRPMPSPDF